VTVGAAVPSLESPAETALGLTVIRASRFLETSDGVGGRIHLPEKKKEFEEADLPG